MEIPFRNPRRFNPDNAEHQTSFISGNGGNNIVTSNVKILIKLGYVTMDCRKRIVSLPTKFVKKEIAPRRAQIKEFPTHVSRQMISDCAPISDL